MEHTKGKTKPDPYYLEWMQDYHEASRKREDYSLARLDTLTVSISGAGLYICLETLRFLVTTGAAAPPAWPVKMAGVFFVLAMAVNFIGQHAGARTNRAAAQWARYEALHERTGEEDPAREQADRESDRYARLARLANSGATILMLAGVVALLGTYITCL